MTNDLRPEKHKVARSFHQAATSYDEVAILQRQTADELLDRLDLFKITPQTILDLGTGTGRNLSLLQQRYPQAQMLALDIAPAMLKQAQQRYRQDVGLKRFWSRQAPPRYLTGDAEQLPLADNSVDLIFANLALQWCQPRSSFQEIQRVLKPGGLFMFTSLGPDTLKELRQAWAAVDDYPHVNSFYDMHDVGDAMTAAGLADVVLDVDLHQLYYDSAVEAMRDLKVLGARNMNAGRRRGLTGKRLMQQVISHYEALCAGNKISASYEVIYGHGWHGEPRQMPRQDGSVAVSISEIGGRK